MDKRNSGKCKTKSTQVLKMDSKKKTLKQEKCVTHADANRVNKAGCMSHYLLFIIRAQ